MAPLPDYFVESHNCAPNILFLAFIKWQCDDLGGGGATADVDLDGLVGNGVGGVDVAHADVFVEGWAGCATGEGADLLVTSIDGVAAAADATFGHFDADELLFESLGFGFDQCVTSDKFDAFIEFHRPAQVGFQWISLLVKFMAVEAVTSF